ncbi:MAG: hypothetical protein IH897_11115 [Planctomycetes bacterium]|nr:hypothetical protein [Planctomycetota bacterium]
MACLTRLSMIRDRLPSLQNLAVAIRLLRFLTCNMLLNVLLRHGQPYGVLIPIHHRAGLVWFVWQTTLRNAPKPEHLG